MVSNLFCKKYIYFGHQRLRNSAKKRIQDYVSIQLYTFFKKRKKFKSYIHLIQTEAFRQLKDGEDIKIHEAILEPFLGINESLLSQC